MKVDPNSADPTQFLFSSALDTSKRELRLFISSTFLDMSVERSLLVSQVFPQIQDLCSKRDIQFSYVDLRWGITEEESKQGQTVLQCLNELDRCNMFLCMLGGRYGWSQSQAGSDPLLQQSFVNASAQHPWVMNFLDRSVTEIEIIRALGWHHTIGLTDSSPPIHNSYVFLRSSVSDQHQNGDPLAEKKLKDLKHRIQTSNGPYVSSYVDATSFSDETLNLMQSFIERKFPEIRRSELEEARWCHTNAAKSYSRSFVGRDDVLRTLTAHVRKAQGSEGIVIVGPAGIGKSALLGHWTGNQLISIDPKSISVISHFVGATGSSADHLQILVRFLREIRELYSLKFSVDDIPIEEEELIKFFTLTLNDLPSHSKLVIVLDGIDRLNADGRSDVTNLKWIGHLPAHVKFVGSSRNSINGFKCLTLPPFSISERTSFVQNFFSEFSKKLSAGQIQRIVSHVKSNHPDTLKLIVSYLSLYASHDTLEETITMLLESENVEILFQHFFDEMATRRRTDSRRGRSCRKIILHLGCWIERSWIQCDTSCRTDASFHGRYSSYSPFIRTHRRNSENRRSISPIFRCLRKMYTISIPRFPTRRVTPHPALPILPVT
eukprot:TRINITY_DN5873_c1_g1_i2.p1 TRINITY_DN5873_c1_g1~~TRINITY_DN5873_c1_g1_i2.p1  ORF type:complete len:679 (+),score=126.79 TRINITY_DN5873_c1_g1_i2:221-2038(+)